MKISPSVKVLTVAMSIIAALTGWTSIAINHTIGLTSQAKSPKTQLISSDVSMLQQSPNVTRPTPLAVTRSSR